MPETPGPAESPDPAGSPDLGGREPRRSLAALLARLERLGIGLRLVARAAAPAGPASPPPGRPAFSGAAHRELCHLLARQSGGRVPADAWRLDWSESGRPLVTGPEPGFYASIAYTRHGFVVAAAAGRRLGIDLEPDRAVPEEDIPLHLLSPAETALVRDDPARFVTIWTLKEALAKERGEGLLADCRTLDAAPFARAEPFTLVPRADGGMACHARFASGDETYRLALAFGPLEP